MGSRKAAFAFGLLVLATSAPAWSTAVTGVVFDNEDAFAASHQVPGNPAADRGVGATVSVSSDTPITDFALLTFQQVPGDLKFVIYDEGSGSFVWTGAAATFSPDAFDGDGNADFTFKTSPTMHFTLLAGHTYDLGAISDVENYYAYGLGPSVSENGITSTPRNVLLQDYADPSIATLTTADGVHGQAEFALIVDNGTAVPEPPSGALLGVPATALAALAARRRRRAVAGQPGPASGTR